MATRVIPSLMACSALLLASCGPKTLTLPEQPVERAAMCGSVAAATARSTTDINSPLSLEAIGSVLHYPMLAASSGEAFSADTAAAVQKRMAALQDRVAESKWQDMVQPCLDAFPAAAIERVTLPADRFEAQLGCDELGDFLRSSLEMQEEYVNELGKYRDLGNKLEPSVAAGIQARAGSGMAAQQEERRKALAAMAKAGPPVAVMRECLARFG